MPQELLFDLDNLRCGYAGKVVLHIDELHIQKVPITFILGPSGIGKSTLLELLGLMSNTLVENRGNFNFFGRDENPVDLSGFWSWSEKEQSAFRKSKFSFVFQQTNLMHNLNILENLCLPLLVQGYSFEEATVRVSGAAQQMDLPDQLLTRGITEASGGQLQRIAFTRALSADFEVLFGDEPTGNLDETNARNLMTHLKKNLVDRNASAIIVSHDLKLADAFADQIIRIEKAEFEHAPIGRIKSIKHQT